MAVLAHAQGAGMDFDWGQGFLPLPTADDYLLGKERPRAWSSWQLTTEGVALVLDGVRSVSDGQ